MRWPERPADIDPIAPTAAKKMVGALNPRSLSEMRTFEIAFS